MDRTAKMMECFKNDEANIDNFKNELRDLFLWIEGEEIDTACLASRYYIKVYQDLLH